MARIGLFFCERLVCNVTPPGASVPVYYALRSVTSNAMRSDEVFLRLRSDVCDGTVCHKLDSTSFRIEQELLCRVSWR